jgi:drug/metabolite transporter (DMT)-like permease
MAVTQVEAGSNVDRSTLLAFILFVTLAGGNVVAIRYISCDGCELDPFWAAGSRFAVAAVILAGIAFAVRADMPRGRALVGAITYGVLGFAAPFGLAYWGLQRASAAFGAVVLATIPLMTLLLALAHRQERFRWQGLTGGLLALAGMAVIFNEGLDAGVPVSSLVAFLVAAACFAETNIVVKAFPRVHPAAMNAIGLGTGGVVLLLLSFAVGEAHAVPELARTWIAQMYLVVLGSVAVFTLYVYVIHRWTASAVSYEGVLIPLAAILFSVWLQDEQISWTFAGGSALVLLGVYFGALRGEDAHGA